MLKDQIERVRAREERRRLSQAARRGRMRVESDAAMRRAEDEARAPDDGGAWSTTCADPVEAAERLVSIGSRQSATHGSRQSAIGGRGGDIPDAPSGPASAEPPTADCRLPTAESTAGVMIQRDEIARLRLALSMEIDARAAALIAARNPNDAADVKRARDLNNLLMLGLITDAQRSELDGLNARVGWARRVEEVAREAKRAIADASAERLESFEPAEIEWPE